MDLRLFSIENIPKTLPAWETILEDLGQPPAPRIARALDVGASTVYRWSQAGPPRMALLSLFWLTRWGRSQIDSRATNDALAMTGLARSLADERAQLRSDLSSALDERDELTGMVRRLSELLRPEHSTYPRAGHSHTDNDPWRSAQPARLQWPAVPDLVGTEVVGSALAWPSLDDHRGSLEARPPSARSGKSPMPERMPPLPPSSPAEDVSLSPLVALRRQNDAIVASELGSACHLLELRQAQGTAATSNSSARLNPKAAAERATSSESKMARLDGAKVAVSVTTNGARVRHSSLATAAVPAACGPLSGPAAQPRLDAFAAIAAHLAPEEP